MGAGAGPAALALQTFGAIFQGVEANAGHRRAAAALDENGRQTLLQGEYDALAVRKDERAATGEMLAAQGGSGLVMGTGSLADLIEQNAYNREVDILNLRRKATTDANNLYSQAAEERQAGRAKLTQSLFSAASGALEGVAKLRAQNNVREQTRVERSSQLTQQRKTGERSQPWEAGAVTFNPSALRVPRMSVLKW